MQKGFILFSFLFFLTAPFAYMQPGGNTAISTENQDMVEKSILDWADKTFEFYDGARFEKFEAATSTDYMKLSSKLEGMKEYKQEISDQFASGELSKTKDEFDKMMSRTDRKIDSLQNLVNTTPAGSSGYEVDFWANILTNSGLTVYYKHHVTLNKDYVVTGYKMTSAVGKTNDEQKILLKDKK
jgi:hypothetical protein